MENQSFVPESDFGLQSTTTIGSKNIPTIKFISCAEIGARRCNSETSTVVVS